MTVVPSAPPDFAKVEDGFPRMALVRQRFAAATPIDLAGEISRQLAPRLATVKPGTPVAVAVGSRGIANLQALVAATIRTLQAAGANPFLVPAMGSHGGGTAEGQTRLLAEYGVTEANLGVPFRASMDVREVGRTAEREVVVCSVEALRAEALVMLNRIKPHTDFSGDLGSGLLKMLVVGLGKQVGATNFHRAAARRGYVNVLREWGRILRQHLPLLAAVAVVENQRHETARIEVVAPEALEAREAALCGEARTLMPRLPFDELDLLIVDRMGKNISGTGMDPAVIGRMIHGYSLAEEAEHRHPHVRRLFVRDLTPESNGNAIGLGMADFTTSRLVRAMDRNVTVTNALTALSLQGAKVPIHFETDREVVAAALSTLSLPDPRRARVVRIADTLSVEWLQISEALAGEAGSDSGCEIAGGGEPMRFDAEGNLASWPPVGVA